MSVILHVEDDLSHALLVRRVLAGSTFSCEVRHVTDGQAAVDYLLRHENFVDPLSSPRPDLVLLDLNLPKLKGLDVLKKIKGNEQLCDIPVVIFTTSDSEEDSRLSYTNNADCYLTKPVSYSSLVALLHRVMTDWLNKSSH